MSDNEGLLKILNEWEKEDSVYGQISDMMLKKQISVEALAEAICWNEMCVERMLMGEVDITVKDLLRIAKELDVEVDIKFVDKEEVE